MIAVSLVFFGNAAEVGCGDLDGRSHMFLLPRLEQLVGAGGREVVGGEALATAEIGLEADG
jgi:hypothetical protein